MCRERLFVYKLRASVMMCDILSKFPRCVKCTRFTVSFAHKSVCACVCICSSSRNHISSSSSIDSVRTRMDCMCTCRSCQIYVHGKLAVNCRVLNHYQRHCATQPHTRQYDSPILISRTLVSCVRAFVCIAFMLNVMPVRASKCASTVCAGGTALVGGAQSVYIPYVCIDTYAKYAV